MWTYTRYRGPTIRMDIKDTFCLLNKLVSSKVKNECCDNLNEF